MQTSIITHWVAGQVQMRPTSFSRWALTKGSQFMLWPVRSCSWKAQWKLNLTDLKTKYFTSTTWCHSNSWIPILSGTTQILRHQYYLVLLKLSDTSTTRCDSNSRIPILPGTTQILRHQYYLVLLKLSDTSTAWCYSNSRIPVLPGITQTLGYQYYLVLLKLSDTNTTWYHSNISWALTDRQANR